MDKKQGRQVRLPYQSHECPAGHTAEKGKPRGGDEMDKPTPDRARGKTIEENGTEYFEYNNVRIKITEHFPNDGKRIDELITELIRHKVKEKVR